MTLLAQEKQASMCSEQVRNDFKGSSLKMLDQLVELGSVSLGDAGEAGDREKYLNRFRRFIDYFDTAFTNQQLMKIIRQNECPLVTCYAFHALVKSKGQRISDKAVQDLVLRFAKDTTSSVDLDWGCSSTVVSMFDYLLCLVTYRDTRPVFGYVRPLSKTTTETILQQRRPYFSNRGLWGQEMTWQRYCEGFLE